MKRPHRRIHILFWILITPITALVGYLSWQMRPETLFTELPAGIEEISDTATDASEPN